MGRGVVGRLAGAGAGPVVLVIALRFRLGAVPCAAAVPLAARLLVPGVVPVVWSASWPSVVWWSGAAPWALSVPVVGVVPGPVLVVDLFKILPARGGAGSALVVDLDPSVLLPSRLVRCPPATAVLSSVAPSW